MKILIIGDFHGKFPEKLYRIAKSKEIDLIISTGDFANVDKIRKLIFKNWTEKHWAEVIGLKKTKQLEKESFDSGLKILKKLNSLGKKVYIIFGNSDFYKDFPTEVPKSLILGDYNNKIKRLKNLILADKKKKKISGFELVGHGGYVDVTEFIKKPIDKEKKKQQKRLKRYRKDEQKLKNLFLKKKPKKGFIFLIHYTPYGIFDKVKLKSSPMYGKHVGWQPYNNIIKRYKPAFVICGHMHENHGKKSMGKSIIINPGPAYEGKAGIIEIDENKKRIKSIKFVK